MEKDFDFDAVGKRTPFRTPEGFFQRMQAETLKRVEEEKQIRKFARFKWGVSMALAVAAMVCGFIFFPAKQTVVEEPSYTDEWMALMSDDTDAMDLYLQELTDEELEEWMEFSENDIFYELTTQNLNENED